ncbi:hypothetical protein [Pseudomonas putida]|uniref:hypothetical protein n=1 Tax=Pseudomonas putida TaxID=303 RepID=UPI00223EA663|nr:hypothetical protein [Pseudomonas putida]UZM91852.1 hypothetical protein OPZ46_18450 [Pseudomonas putida DOT-T1E]
MRFTRTASLRSTLPRGGRFSSNLFEDKPDLAQQLIDALQAWMGEMPGRCARFELGTVDFSGYGPLTPTGFILRTQAAPGARVRDAVNYGDGAVLVFIRLRDSLVDGQPPGTSYPYLLPDGDYSATLVLNKDMLGHASDDGLELLARLLFPELNAFVKKVDSTPLDRVMFGNIDPLRTQLTVKPTMGTVVTAGKTQQFRLYDGKDQMITASAWSVINPQSHDDAGHGSIDGNGLFTAPSPEVIGQEVQTFIIKAEYKQGEETYHAAARALVISEPVLAMPAFGAYRPQESADGIDLWNAGLGNVSFEMLGQPLGQIASLGNGRSRFVPDQQASRRILGVQQLQASSTAKGYNALVLVNNQPLVSVDPPFVPRVGHGEATQLSEVNRIMPNETRRWRMLAGPGSVSPSGHFRASELAVSQPNVVTCEVVRNGVVFAAGYSVVKETAVKAVSGWVDLQRFTLTVGKSPDGVTGTVGSNGYQQLELEVTVETMQANGQDYKLCLDEIASIALYDRSGMKIPFLCGDGIDSGSGNVWRTNLKPNDFIRANESLMATEGHGPQPAAPRGAEDRTIRLQLFLHRRGTTFSEVFYAGFQAKSGRFFYSNDTSDQNATIEVKVHTPAAYKPTDYTFVRKRVAGGGTSEGTHPEHEDFDLHPETDDYWMLDYRGGSFYTAEFIKTRESDNDKDVNTSMVRWESSYSDEFYRSYTGYVFQDYNKPKPEFVSFDPDSTPLINGVGREVSSVYEPGLLAIVNFRRRDLPYYSATLNPAVFKKLSKPLRVQLRDAQGNLHIVQIDYLSPDTIGDRNILVHTVPSRPTGRETPIIRLSNYHEGERV